MIVIGDKEIKTGQELKEFLGPEQWTEFCNNVTDAIYEKIVKKIP